MPKISEKNRFSPSEGGLACSGEGAIAPKSSPGLQFFKQGALEVQASLAPNSAKQALFLF